ncbi:plasmid pRiA4b ORF-3 family protein [Tomitella biformata]|uniref:plasmid pRiA4b ORF-3 family protein n=1 Tax=Tomitella biformata TaxID=630403 RepID=UPI00046594B5|nr:plasmid pRiA4b ORF-3 family protein [Tomitella biformata]
MANFERGRRAHLSLVPPLADDGGAPPERTGEARRRRPRRPDIVTYTLRIGLEDVEPEIWRRFTVSSDIMLDALHPVLQTVMGWNDSQLHCFISASAKYSDDALRFDQRPRFDAPDGSGAYAYEDSVRLDEVLADEGDLLFYEYNFSDSWQHTILLEGIGGPAEVSASVCLDGARNCPPEHSGGAYGYAQLLEALAPAAQLAQRRRPDWPIPQLDPERFKAKEITRQLRRQTRQRAHHPGPATLAAALLRLIPELAAPELYSLLGRVHFREESEHGMTTADNELATAGLRWLLARIGDDGRALTPAGYLRPADVVIARAELGWDGDPKRVSKRESDCRELLDLRKAAEFLGLTRTAGGRLLRTELGDALRTDPAGLLAHIAAALPAGAAELERDAGLLFLLLMACGPSADTWEQAMAEAMTAMGWRTDGRPVDPQDVFAMAGPTVLVARGLGAFGVRPGPENGLWGPRWGRELARTVLLRPRG